MPDNGPGALNRRQLLGTLGAVAGSAALTGAAAASGSDRVAAPPCSVRIAAVSYGMPFHDHRAKGVNLEPLREMTARVARDRPDFICYPEGCTCVAAGFEKSLSIAPELEPYAAAVGQIAREFQTAIVAPFIERRGDRFYNSVPIVDRQGRLVLCYRKNYPTTLELEAGISPGDEVPVGVCDGIRVGAAVCFDLNFSEIAEQLEAQRAQLVFWPSMYWGGRLLQHWSLRHGFALAAAYGLESAIVDHNGEFLARQGTETYQVRQGHLPPWALADVLMNRELFHLDENQAKFVAIREKYAADVEFEVFEPEGFFLLGSRRADLPIDGIAKEFGLETLRDYLARSVRLRNSRLKG